VPPPFHRFTGATFGDALARFAWTRRVTSVHLHHTWRPRRADWRGFETVVAMWRYHTVTNGWRDIAQHLTIAPDGGLWTGRDWNAPPASSGDRPGNNGTRAAGPFMIELVGDFDVGRDPFDGAQRAAALGVIARLQLRFTLPPDSLRFHRDLGSEKSCPGSSIEYADVLTAVAAERRRLSVVMPAAPAA